MICLPTASWKFSSKMWHRNERVGRENGSSAVAFRLAGTVNSYKQQKKKFPTHVNIKIKF